ncbi:MAG TPA: DUF3883 domain-containing protein, partial [Candidatus Deferrimicrobium sp.]|nr:DUF3883 domain-containing protein [Candidatus Deferrimicrobium sp.]
ILFYEGAVKDGTGRTAGKRLFSFYTHEAAVRSIPPSILWDLDEKDGYPHDPHFDPDRLKKQVTPIAIEDLQTYRLELQEKRDRQSMIKEKYGVRSLDHLIWKLDGELIALYARRDAGENVDLVINNKEESKKRYEYALEELKDTIAREKSLTLDMPRFLGVIRVVPAAGVKSDMRTDLEIERIGVEVVMAYEKEKGRCPENVSENNLGFDIRSTGPDGSVRYIEVKARAHTGNVALTQNEWFKAHRFGDEYYLYVVMNAASRPELFIYRDPVNCLEPAQVIDTVRYIIPFEQLKEKGEAVQHDKG